MTDQGMTYETWIDEALRGVVRRAFEYASTEGLAGDHHFYVTFRTHSDGLEMPPRLRAQHPDQMTIVLQHQFWGLAVDDEAFSVTLKFRGRSERLRIPFAAITAFADPSVNFGLQFKLVPVAGAADGTPGEEEEAAGDQAAAEADSDRPGSEDAGSVPQPAAGEAEDQPAGGTGAADEKGEESGKDQGEDRSAAEVIVLDSFRKT